MNLFKKKCQYCGIKIEREKEIFKDVKVPALIGLRKKPFCCSKHASDYEKEIEEHLNKQPPIRSCCG